MATYIMLGNFTDQGIRNVKDTTKRADAVREAGKKHGVNMKEIFWTMGQYDMVVTIEAPDEASVSAFALAVGAAGNIRGQTLRAHSRDEMNAILAKLP
jgi:uncharacterized protein with GYD domain